MPKCIAPHCIAAAHEPDMRHVDKTGAGFIQDTSRAPRIVKVHDHREW